MHTSTLELRCPLKITTSLAERIPVRVKSLFFVLLFSSAYFSDVSAFGQNVMVVASGKSEVARVNGIVVMLYFLFNIHTRNMCRKS